MIFVSYNGEIQLRTDTIGYNSHRLMFTVISMIAQLEIFRPIGLYLNELQSILFYMFVDIIFFNK